MAAPGVGSSLRRTFGAPIVLATTACASVQGRYTAIPLTAAGQSTHGRQTASGLVVSGGELTRYSSELFGSIEVTFENRP